MHEFNLERLEKENKEAHEAFLDRFRNDKVQAGFSFYYDCNGYLCALYRGNIDDNYEEGEYRELNFIYSPLHGYDLGDGWLEFG